MPAPTIQSVQYTDDALYIIFNRAVTNVSDLDAFTFAQESGNPFVPSFDVIDANAIVATTVGLPDSELTVSYDDPGAGTSQVQSAADNTPALDFADQAAVPYFVPGIVTQVVAGQGGNDLIHIRFSEPVGATGDNLLVGLTITLDGEALDLLGATTSLSSDQTALTIATGVNFPYNGVVSVEYDDMVGHLYSWPSGDVPSFEVLGVPNLSTDGLPDSDYPLSIVTAEPVKLLNSVALPELYVYLNPVDRDLVKKYGPVQVYTGGTFGETLENPEGVVIVGGKETLSDGLILAVRVTASSTAYAVEAARDWLEVVGARVSIALGKVRALDQSVPETDSTLRMV